MNDFTDLNLTNEEIDMAIKMADTDGDGKISFDEYKATITKKGISYYIPSLHRYISSPSFSMLYTLPPTSPG